MRLVLLLALSACFVVVTLAVPSKRSAGSRKKRSGSSINLGVRGEGRGVKSQSNDRKKRQDEDSDSDDASSSSGEPPLCPTGDKFQGTCRGDAACGQGYFCHAALNGRNPVCCPTPCPDGQAYHMTEAGEPVACVMMVMYYGMACPAEFVGSCSTPTDPSDTGLCCPSSVRPVE